MTTAAFAIIEFLTVFMASEAAGHRRDRACGRDGLGQRLVTHRAIFLHPLDMLGMRHAQFGRRRLGIRLRFQGIGMAKAAIALCLLFSMAFEALALFGQMALSKRFGVEDLL